MKYLIRIQLIIKNNKLIRKLMKLIIGNLGNNNRVYEEVWNNPKNGFGAAEICQ